MKSQFKKAMALCLLFNAFGAASLVAFNVSPMKSESRSCFTCNQDCSTACVCPDKKKDCPVGTWSVTLSLGKFLNLPAHCVMTFHDDGTVFINTLLDIFNVPTGYEGPVSGDGIIGQGCWRRTGRRTFKVITTSVLKVGGVVKEVESIFPIFLREKSVLEVTVNKKCDELELKGIKLFYNVHDLCLENPLKFPIINKPIIIKCEGIGCKLDCKKDRDCDKDHHDKDNNGPSF